MQADAGKAQASLPIWIDMATFSDQADSITLQCADQHSARDHQQQPIDAQG